MAGTKSGGMKAYQTKLSKYGAGYFSAQGRKGGLVRTDKPKGFAALPKEHAAAQGRKGGSIRPKRRSYESTQEFEETDTR